MDEETKTSQLSKPGDLNPSEELSEGQADKDAVEVIEAFKELPLQERRIFSSLIARFTSGPEPSPISKKLTSEHITQLIEASDKDSQREFQSAQSAETTKRLAMAALLALVLFILGYAGLTKDKELAEKVMTAGIGALGGYGVGVATAKQKKS